ncbi:hypothetical protein ONS95_013063 [Cadophora gregata]|uniref:uncharacterized protein n=1 Tax=Cadophora gregata TaxID=51156 RepID=UPI0026DAD145|nr:uncharacterized protein ONS95_013063 [Cadophora gregata]KAK0100946.1 hypothetical protein ONS96_006179 [Cadophora gregata f. sp. sojae]KAK0116026.1 hypothetical protein ONS95_013063 [Cadophora gregata]
MAMSNRSFVYVGISESSKSELESVFASSPLPSSPPPSSPPPPYDFSTATSTTSVPVPSYSSSTLSGASNRFPRPVDLSGLDQQFTKLDEILSRMTSTKSVTTSPPINNEKRATNLHTLAKDTQGPSSFLKKLPLEVRRMVYGYLLVNPLLSQIEAIESRFESRANHQYELCPAVLRTCRQVYQEASDVLYEKNTFIVSCIGHEFGFSGDGTRGLGSARLLECPLTRYDSDTNMNLAQFAKQPQFGKVKHWKVMVSCFAGYEYAQTTELLEFCRLLFFTQPKSVTVLSVGKEFTREWRGFHEYEGPFVGDKIFPASTVFAPLNILRNLRELKFEASGTEEVAYDIQLDAKIVAESGSPSPLSMYASVLGYAQSFERSQIFRGDMGKVRWCCREHMAIMPSPNKFLRQTRHDRKFINPFKTSVTHPVENSLELAKFACDENDLDDFKVQRRVILEYLEPQYQRIADFMDQLRAFVNKQKGVVNGRPGILSPDAVFRNDEVADVGEQMEDLLEGTLLLEDCARAFVRDLSPEVRRIVRLYQERFDSQYDTHSRDRVVQGSLNKAFLSADWQDWFYDFKRAAKNMMEQYLRIRDARKKLFESDVGSPEQDRGCNISLETWRCDKILDWEPRIGEVPGSSSENAYIIVNSDDE